MGATAADTKREIAEIQHDISSAVSELQHRVARTFSPATYLAFARENPAAIVGVGLAGLSLAGVLVARSLADPRRRSAPAGALLGSVAKAAIAAGSGEAGAAPTRTGQSMLKRMLWAGLAATAMAAGGLAARRLSATIWRSAMGEAPPTGSD